MTTGSEDMDIDNKLDRILGIDKSGNVEAVEMPSFELGDGVLKEEDSEYDETTKSQGKSKEQPLVPSPKALSGLNVMESQVEDLQSLVYKNGYRQVITGLTAISNWGKKNNKDIYEKSMGLKKVLKEWKTSLPKDEQKKLIV